MVKTLLTGDKLTRYEFLTGVKSLLIFPFNAGECEAILLFCIIYQDCFGTLLLAIDHPKSGIFQKSLTR
jgi:hypothetical protein